MDSCSRARFTFSATSVLAQILRVLWIGTNKGRESPFIPPRYVRSFGLLYVCNYSYFQMSSIILDHPCIQKSFHIPEKKFFRKKCFRSRCYHKMLPSLWRSSYWDPITTPSCPYCLPSSYGFTDAYGLTTHGDRRRQNQHNGESMSIAIQAQRLNSPGTRAVVRSTEGNSLLWILHSSFAINLQINQMAVEISPSHQFLPAHIDGAIHTPATASQFSCI